MERYRMFDPTSEHAMAVWTVQLEDGSTVEVEYNGNGGFGPVNVWTGTAYLAPVVARERKSESTVAGRPVAESDSTVAGRPVAECATHTYREGCPSCEGRREARGLWSDPYGAWRRSHGVAPSFARHCPNTSE